MKNCILFLCTCFLVSCAWNKPTHKQFFIADTIEPVSSVSGRLYQRIILFGDAGKSSLDPWEPLLKSVALRAKLNPLKTSIIALGDNIYPDGFPEPNNHGTYSKHDYHEINALQAQLNVAGYSGAEMYLVPGNHDWLPGSLDLQQSYIHSYSNVSKTSVHLYPDSTGDASKAIHLASVTFIFMDSERLLNTNKAELHMAMETLTEQIKEAKVSDPNKTVLLSAHHPIQTMGVHGKYITGFNSWITNHLLRIFKKQYKQDIDSPEYKRYINAINQTVEPFNRIIYAAGHEHNLQVFKGGDNFDYSLVSGAANEEKITGVWHNKHTLLAQAVQGYLELEILSSGVFLRLYSSDNNFNEATTGFWLWKENKSF